MRHWLPASRRLFCAPFRKTVREPSPRFAWNRPTPITWPRNGFCSPFRGQIVLALRSAKSCKTLTEFRSRVPRRWPSTMGRPAHEMLIRVSSNICFQLDHRMNVSSGQGKQPTGHRRQQMHTSLWFHPHTALRKACPLHVWFRPTSICRPTDTIISDRD